jgi:hypothetical protein
MAQAKSGSNTAVMILVVVLLLAFVGVGVWWLLMKDKKDTSTPVTTTPEPDKTKYVGKIYGNPDLSEMYQVIDRTYVKRVKVGEKCTSLSWSLSDKNITFGEKLFKIDGANTIKDSDGVIYDELTGDIDSYCKLIGE